MISDGIEDSITVWEDNWEHGEYPFVRLEGNRATCAICLMDFEEPKKSEKHNNVTKPVEETSNEKAEERENREIVELEDDEESHSQLHLEDAGEGAQPLRLLPCGHAFHVSILFCVFDRMFQRFCVTRKHVLILGLLTSRVVVLHVNDPLNQNKAKRQRATDRITCIIFTISI